MSLRSKFQLRKVSIGQSKQEGILSLTIVGIGSNLIVSNRTSGSGRCVLHRAQYSSSKSSQNLVGAKNGIKIKVGTIIDLLKGSQLHSEEHSVISKSSREQSGY